MVTLTHTGHRMIWVEPSDRWPAWTFAVVAGGLGAIALAVWGLPAWDFHGPFHRFGVMDPLCGMTRAVRFAARGQLGSAWRYNPGAFLLAGFVLVGVPRILAGAVLGRWWAVRLGPKRLWIAIGIVAVVALEVNQQLHATLLRGP